MAHAMKLIDICIRDVIYVDNNNDNYLKTIYLTLFI